MVNHNCFPILLGKGGGVRYTQYLCFYVSSQFSQNGLLRVLRQAIKKQLSQNLLPACPLECTRSMEFFLLL